MNNGFRISGMRENSIAKVIFLSTLLMCMAAGCGKKSPQKGAGKEVPVQEKPVKKTSLKPPVKKVPLKPPVKEISAKRPVSVKTQQTPLRKIEKWGDAPDFTLPKLGGGEFTLSSLKGRVIILDFWATWCPPCLKEIPDFITLKKEYKDRGLEIVGVALDRDGEDAVGPFARKVGINYIIVFGGEKVAKKYGGIRGIPTTFIIDRKGNAVKKYIGFRSRDVFEREIKKLLGKGTKDG